MAENKVGEAFVELRYRLDRLTNDFRGVERQVATHAQGLQRTIASGFGRLGGIVAAPFRQLGGMMRGIENQAATLAGTFGGIALGAGIVQTNVEFERLNAVLKTVTGSAEAGQRAFADLEEFAAQTPFTLDEAVRGFARLKALGIEPTMERMRAFGNVAAAMGTDMMQFVEAVADASTGEFERLKEFGIRASAEGERVSFTFQGVTTTVGKNAAEIATYLESIGKVQFGSAMTDQMGALPGLFANLSDAAGAFARQIGEAGLNQGLKDMGRALLDAGNSARPFAETLGSMAGGALTRLSEALKSALGWFNGLTPEMRSFAIEAAAIGTALAVAVPALALFVASIGTLATPLGAAVIGLATAGAAFIAFNDKINAFLAGSWQNIRRDFEAVKNAAAALGVGFGTLEGEVSRALGAVGLVIRDTLGAALETARMLAEGLRSLMAPALDAVAGAAGRFGPAVAGAFSSPVQPAQAMGDAIGLMADVVEQGLNAALAAARNMGAALATALNGLAAPVAAFKDAFKEAVTGSIGEMQRLVGGVQEWLAKPWDLSAVKSNVESVKGFFQGLYMSVVGGSIVPDMVREVGSWFDRLGPLMTQPVANAADAVEGEFRRLQEAAKLAEAARVLENLPLPPEVGPIDMRALGAPPVPGRKPAVPAAAAAAKPAGTGGAAGADAEAAARRERIADLRFEVDAMRRLAAAQAESAAAGERMRVAIEAERAARELGGKATAAQRGEIARLTQTLAEQEAAGERAQAAAALRVEVEEIDRLTEAYGRSQAAGEAMERQIEAEGAARALGIGATAEEIDATKKLTLAKLEGAAALGKMTEKRAEEAARMAEYNAQFKEIEEEAFPGWKPTLLGPQAGAGPDTSRMTGYQQYLASPGDPDLARMFNPAAGAADALKQYVSDAKEYGTLAGQAIASGLSFAEDAIVGFALKGESVFESLKSLAEDMAETMLRFAIRQSMAMMMMGMGFGGAQPGMAGAGMTTSARGNVFRFGRVEPFAHGGIVGKPTIFPMARGVGLMGEAGPEAIMPLKRTSGGRLGVEVADGGGRRGGDVTVNVVNNGAVPAENVSTRETTSPNGGRQIEVMIERAVGRQLSQGRLDRAMQQRYGAKPRAT